VLAYLTLWLNGLLRAPLWPDLNNKGKIQLDAIIWACLNMYAHFSSLLRLLLDERAVHLTDDDEALW